MITIDTENQKIVDTQPNPDIITDYTMQGCLDNMNRIGAEIAAMQIGYDAAVAQKEAQKAKYQAYWDAGIAGGLDAPTEPEEIINEEE